MTTPGVDFFRLDRSGQTKRLLVVATIMVSGGASAVGAHLVHRLPDEMSHVISLTGGIAMIGGLVMAFGTMALMLFEDVFLSIREDGLLVHDNGRETVIAWDDLLGVVAAGDGIVELRRADKDPVRWFAGKAAEDVRGRIEEAKRKAAHGLSPTASRRPPPSAP